MRWICALSLTACLALPAIAQARERSIQELPKDVWDLTFAWTEPLKVIARETRRTNPVSGIWHGLLYGPFRTADRATDIMDERENLPGPEAEKQFRYSF